MSTPAPGGGPALEGEAARALFQANLSALAACQPELAKLVERAPVADWDLVTTRNGAPGARAEGRLLHSVMDPAREAARLAGAAERGADTVIVLGLGLGYLLEAVLDLPGVERVILCEAEPGAFGFALRARNLAAAVGDPRLAVVLGGDPAGLLAALDALGTRSSVLIGQPSLEALAAPWYAALREVHARRRSMDEINAATLARFGRLWVRNIARNAPLLGAAPGLGALSRAFEGLPALVLAAGPSLELVLPVLPELRERCLLICVDTALRSVLRAGVEPDLLVVVDPQYWNWRHVADLGARARFLVSEPAVWPPTLRAPYDRVFLAASLYPLGRALGGAGRGVLGAGGSVATSAWDLARLAGAAPIWMAGLDLGYPGGRTHAAASLFEQKALAAGTRRAPAATRLAAALFGAPTELVRANDGGLVASDSRMALYAWWFESRLVRGDAPETRTLSPGGRAIPGLRPDSLETLLALPPRRAELTSRLDALAHAPDGDATAAAAALSTLVTTLASVAALAAEGEGLCAALLATPEGAAPETETLARLDRIDRDIAVAGMGDIVGFLLPGYRDLVGPAARSLADSLATSRRLYALMAASARDQLDALGVGTFGVTAAGVTAAGVTAAGAER